MNKNNIVKSEAMSNAKPAEALAEAIVKMAIHDYISALMALAADPTDEKARWKLDDCTDFFRGEWYAQLSPIEGELMIKMMDVSVHSPSQRQAADSPPVERKGLHEEEDFNKYTLCSLLRSTGEVDAQRTEGVKELD